MGNLFLQQRKDMHNSRNESIWHRRIEESTLQAQKNKVKVAQVAQKEVRRDSEKAFRSATRHFDSSPIRPTRPRNVNTIHGDKRI